MPVITFEGENLTKEQKTALIHGFTKTASECTGIPDRFFSVVLHEQPGENLGFGGETVEELKARLKK
jgi:4-oxalocrotonate tautomerase family enzyme